MKGKQITFYTQQDRVINDTPVGDYLLSLAQDIGISGATVFTAVSGYGHLGQMHHVNLFDYSDQPVMITMIATEDQSTQLFNQLAHLDTSIFFTQHSVEYGFTAGS